MQRGGNRSFLLKDDIMNITKIFEQNGVLALKMSAVESPFEHKLVYRGNALETFCEKVCNW